MKWANDKLRRAAHDYVAALLEACEKAKVKSPLHALTDTDAYPRLQKIPEVEFCVGWLHGVADAIGIKVEALFEQVAAELAAKGKGKARAA